ncbi:MAG TPA: DNA repair protein RadC [Candidatus Binatia bacterium]|nr:DNA repair protein RadC [Candidatus Binatia bacterium]
MTQPIKEWPESDRPREKLLEKGPETLSNAELLAIILRTGDASTGQSALDYGRVLMTQFGESLRQLEEASVQEICATKGIGPAKAAQIKAALELGKRFAEEEIKQGEQFRSSADVFNHYREHLSGLKKEEFHVLLLDAKNRKIRDVRVSEGSLTSSLVHPREVFNPVIRESAAAVILVHNHPSGDPSPSQEDLHITRRLREIGEVMGVRVLDHIVIGKGKYVSFVDDGYWDR